MFPKGESNSVLLHFWLVQPQNPSSKSQLVNTFPATELICSSNFNVIFKNHNVMDVKYENSCILITALNMLFKRPTVPRNTPCILPLTRVQYLKTVMAFHTSSNPQARYLQRISQITV